MWDSTGRGLRSDCDQELITVRYGGGMCLVDGACWGGQDRVRVPH
jgi:hypothetical protein